MKLLQNFTNSNATCVVQEVEESALENEEITASNYPSLIDVRKALDILTWALEQRGGYTDS